MKTRILYLASCLLLATACSETVDETTTPQARDIELSDKTVAFDESNQTRTIYVDEDLKDWCITAVTTDGNTTSLSEADKEAIRSGEGFEKTFDWLTVAVDGNAIALDAAKNETQEERTFSIDLEAGGWVARITGSQTTDKSTIVATPNPVELSFKGDTAVVETGNDTWWVTQVTVEGQTFVPDGLPDDGSRPQDRAIDQSFDWLNVKVDGSTLVLSAAGENHDDDLAFDVTLSNGTSTCTVEGKRLGWPTGYYDGESTIKTTPGSIVFDSQGETVFVETDCQNWWFTNITVDEESRYLGLALQEDKDKLTNERQYKRTFDWLTVEVVSNGLKLTAAPNTDGYGHTFEIEIFNYYQTGYIKGMQRAQ